MSKLDFNFNEITSKLQKKLSNSSVIPRPIAWISTLNENGTVNLAPFSYFAILSTSLLVVSFMKPKDGHKDTYRNIMRTKEAVVNIADLSLLEVLDETSKSLDYNESEVLINNLTLEASKSIETPKIKEASINMEVLLEFDKDMPYRDSDEIEVNIVLLRIQSMSINKDIFDEEKEYILREKLNPISRLDGSNFGKSVILDYKRKHI